MNLFFTSDLHLSHFNIISYSSRPFKTSEEMDETLIERWNKKVRPCDHVYDLGDVSMKRPRFVSHLLKRLNGHRRLVRGNHDIFKTKEYLEVGYEEIYGVRVLHNILFTHIPVHPQSVGRFLMNVHGHTHAQPDYPPVLRLENKFSGGLKKEPQVREVPYFNISVERTSYTPVSLEDLLSWGRKGRP